LPWVRRDATTPASSYRIKIWSCVWIPVAASGESANLTGKLKMKPQYDVDARKSEVRIRI
jgi:hypothetical protein